MKGIPVLVRAELQADFVVRLLFNDGVDGVTDLSDLLTGPVFEPLKDPGYFRRFFIEGGTLTWPNGADIAPETLHARAKATAHPGGANLHR
ncbi:MAG TPA: DUF2442 domain-containing protein [Candidatus Polarisedimenticolaceae bacterium]|nr:DUF2442 domain-containing protein [Candidatus Polarisedimenticolaceae bacterium]